MWRARCNDYVSKPFDRLELLARITTQLRVKEAARAEGESAKSMGLLQRMLPAHVINKLKNNPSKSLIENHAALTVVDVTIVGYTEIMASLPTMEVFSALPTLDLLLLSLFVVPCA